MPSLRRVETTDEFSNGGFGLIVGDDADVELVVDVFLERSLDRVGDPVVSVAEDASAEQREIGDAVAGLGCVCHRGGQCGLVRRVQNQLGKIGPLVGGLAAVRDGLGSRVFFFELQSHPVMLVPSRVESS